MQFRRASEQADPCGSVGETLSTAELPSDALSQSVHIYMGRPDVLTFPAPGGTGTGEGSASGFHTSLLLPLPRWAARVTFPHKPGLA